MVELLVALSILSIVAVATYGAFASGARLRNHARQHLAGLQQQRILAENLQDDLNNLLVHSPNPAIGDSALSLLRHAPRVDNASLESSRDAHKAFASLVCYLASSADRAVVRFEVPIARVEILREVQKMMSADIDSLASSLRSNDVPGAGQPAPWAGRRTVERRELVFTGVDHIEFVAVERTSAGLEETEPGRGDDVTALEVRINNPADESRPSPASSGRAADRSRASPASWRSSEYVFWLPGTIH